MNSNRYRNTMWQNDNRLYRNHKQQTATNNINDLNMVSNWKKIYKDS